jgi:hypothetical protein
MDLVTARWGPLCGTRSGIQKRSGSGSGFWPIFDTFALNVDVFCRSDSALDFVVETLDHGIREMTGDIDSLPPVGQRKSEAARF